MWDRSELGLRGGGDVPVVFVFSVLTSTPRSTIETAIPAICDCRAFWAFRFRTACQQTKDVARIGRTKNALLYLRFSRSVLAGYMVRTTPRYPKEAAITDKTAAITISILRRNYSFNACRRGP